MNRTSNVFNWPSFQESDISKQSLSQFYGLRAKWGWFLADGIALILFGLIAMSASAFTTIISMALFGWLLLLGGIVQSIRSFSTREWSGFFATFLTGVLYVVAGFLILRSPMATAVMLTFLLAPLFMVGGIVRAVSAMATRFPQWGWQAVSGAMSLLLGLLIWNQWPSSGLWLIGTFVGMEMFFGGASILTLAMELKSLSSSPSRGDKLAA